MATSTGYSKAEVKAGVFLALCLALFVAMLFIYGKAARRWLSGEIDDEELMSSVAERYERMVELWQLRNEGSEVVR